MHSDVSREKISEQQEYLMDSWTKLTTLSLSSNQIGGEGATALSKNTSWTNLTTLNLSSKQIGVKGG